MSEVLDLGKRGGYRDVLEETKQRLRDGEAQRAENLRSAAGAEMPGTYH
jgi:hypothetical protein